MHSKSDHQDELPRLTGPYLGQKPPGLIPELFAPGIVSTDALEIEGVFSPNMDEFYFVRQCKGEHPKIHTIQCKEGVWQRTAVEERYGELAISTDDCTMYLGNQFRSRTASGWSELVRGEKSRPIIRKISHHAPDGFSNQYLCF